MNDSSLDARKVTGTIFLLGIISVLMIQVGHQKIFFRQFDKHQFHHFLQF